MELGIPKAASNASPNAFTPAPPVLTSVPSISNKNMQQQLLQQQQNTSTTASNNNNNNTNTWAKRTNSINVDNESGLDISGGVDISGTGPSELQTKFLIDISRGFLIFYFLLVLFWIDTHPNILVLPFTYFSEWVIGDFWRGYPYILLNGNYFLYGEIPKSYLFINLIYKSPEYFLLTYLIFIIIFFKSNRFFKIKFSFFNYKLILISTLIIFLNKL